MIPAHNSHATIDACIAAASDDGCEVLVVDDGSDPPMKAAVRLERPPGRRNRAFACNAGAEAANGEYLFFIDSNKVCADHAPTISLRHLLDMEAAIGIEHMITSRDPSMTESVIIEHGGGALMRRSSFLELGGYDSVAFPRWGLENYDFSMRWLRSKRRIYSPIELTYRYIGDGDVPSPYRNMEVAEADFVAKWGTSREAVTEATLRMRV